MKQRVLFVFFLFTVNVQVNCQQAEQHKFNLNVSIGYARYTTYDLLLNYYNYSGQSLLPINLFGEYRSNKNLYVINLYQSNSEIKPQNIQNNLYAYNHIKLWNGDFYMEYYREIALVHNFIQIFAGVSNNTSIVLQEEFYSNLLFEYGEGYRKSYNLSLLDISPRIMVQLNYNKNFVRMKSAYSIINYSARPDDNFVKQLGVNDAATWKFSTPGNHTGFQFSLFYQYNIWKKAGVTAEYNFLYHSYSSPTIFKYLRMVFLVGINKSF